MFAGIVTGLYFHDESILLAGHGPVLKVFDVQTGKTIAAETLLPANRIHRIVPGPREGDSRKYAAYGSKSLRIFHITRSSTTVSIKLDRLFSFRDWIMDMQWLQDGEIALAFAHNQVEIYNINDEKPVLIDCVQCQVRCILYSARFYGNTRSDLMLASGTVFNEVHLWRISDRNEDGDGVVSRRLIGHEGVIFGVRFDPDGTMLSSVSDDRTIRVWSLVDERQEPLVIYGHTARVWDCQFVDDYLVSISEDATCRVWKNSLKGTPEEIRDREGECLACWEGHFGKNVWSCAINPEHTIVATGGQDSGIRLWSLVSIRNNNIESEDDLSCLNAPPDRTTNLIRTFCLVDFDTVVASTDDGHLIQSGAEGSWKTLHYDSELQHYSVMESSPCSSVILVGLLNGRLLVYSPKGLFEPFKVHVHNQKIFQIFINPSKDGDTFYIVTSVYNEESVFHKLDISEPNMPKFTTLYKLEGPTERTTIIATAIDQEHQILICGSRESALLVYHLPDMNATDISRQSIAPIMQLRRSHGKQAVSSVTIKPTDEKNVIVFWTTGRDGCFIEYRLTYEQQQQQEKEDNAELSRGIQLGIASRGDTVVRSQGWTLEKVYRNRVTKGWVEGVIWINGELLFLGFYRKRFFVYNEPKNYEMISVACGGAHRRWQFKTADAKLDRATFAFFRKEMLYAYFRNGEVEKKGFKNTILQHHYHGREVRALEYFEYKPPLDAQSALLFATGGEDTLLKLHQYIPNSENKFVTLASIRKHRSVIKTLAWSQGKDILLFTAGGNEELWCWKVEITEGEPVGINCLEWALCPAVSTIAETRIMDVTVYAVESHPGLHFVGAAYSDSSMRVWLFNEATRKFSLLADGTWHNRCLLQISHLVLSDRILFLTSATDGRVAVWDLSQALYSSLEHVNSLEADPTSTATKFEEPIYAHKFHQSGVNALHAVTRGDEILLVTGGEDNAIAAARLKIQSDGSLTTVGEPYTIPNAHASSVTGIKFAASNTHVFSTSTDQRLNVWKVGLDNSEGVFLALADAAFVDVPDPSVMDVIKYNNEHHAAISGVGLQSFIKIL